MLQKNGYLILALSLATTFLGGCLPETTPPHTYLTWRKADTSRTMTVNFHSSLAEKEKKVWVHYDTQSHDGNLTAYAYRNNGDARALETINRRVHTIDLTNLVPGATYYFVVSDGTKALTAEKKFRTLPEGDAPVHFVTGGDMDTTDATRELNRRAAEYNPQFALIGGDIAYDNGFVTNFGKWDAWLDSWVNDMVTPEGYSVPIVMSIGNHEVLTHFYGNKALAPFFTHYFAQDPKRTYFSRKFGENMIVYVLDSGHATRHDGAQLKWMKQEMARTAHIQNRFALYHVPLYPSVREDNYRWSELGRKHWLPLFDQFRLTAAFENHDHALKRTYPMRGNQVAEGGTIYLGDGCWGKETRPHVENRWYLEHVEPTRHFWVGVASSSGVSFQAVDPNGQVRDAVTISHEASMLLGSAQRF